MLYQFTIEKEKDNTLNFFDVKISRKENRLTLDVFRKPICTDIVIHATSIMRNKNVDLPQLSYKGSNKPL